MISGGIWELENAEIMMEQSFLGFFWPLTEVENGDFLLVDAIGEGKAAQCSETHVAGRWFPEDCMVICKPETAFYSLKVCVLSRRILASPVCSL